MSIYCMSCKSPKVHEIVEENKVFYLCRSCGDKSGRVINIDSSIKVINTSRGIKHIAVAAIIIQNEKLLLVKRRTHPFGLELPAGHVEHGETLEQTLSREVYEEVSLKVIGASLICQVEHPVSYCRYGSDIEEWAVFNVTCENGLGFIGNNEIDAVLWFPLIKIPVKKLTPPALFVLKKLGYINYKQRASSSSLKNYHANI